MTIRYKLTTQDLTTHNGCKWVLNEWKQTDGYGQLCTEGWLHCYTSPLLAMMLNRIHACIVSPRLFEVEVDGMCLTDFGLKEGWTRMRLVKELEVPNVSIIQKIAFGILCAKIVCKEETWNKWADKWLSGEDRTISSANDIYFSALKTSTSASYAVASARKNKEKSYQDYVCHFAAQAVNYAAGQSNPVELIKLANEAMKYE